MCLFFLGEKMRDFQKQNVQWFPGHMAKTRRLLQQSLRLVDGVVEIVDARIPSSSRNPEIDSLLGGKPRILVMNKCDLADAQSSDKWAAYYKSAGMSVLLADCKSGRGLNRFSAVVRSALAETIARYDEKGMTGRPLRLMVVGIPNVGKSSLINRLSRTSRAKVADKAGVTRQNQWFVVGGGIELLDTPGVLWPKFDDPAVGDKLAFTGAVKDEITDRETLACRFLELLSQAAPEAAGARYKITDYQGLPGWQILEMIGRKRGFILRGGEIDYERTAVILFDEYRDGKLGRITLDIPQ